MDYKNKYLKYKKKYLEIKKGGSLNWNVFDHGNQQPTQNPALPPTPHPDILKSICSICHNNINEGDIKNININAYVKFNCGHKFHYGCCGEWCAQKWERNEKCLCPECRYEQDGNVTLIKW